MTRTSILCLAAALFLVLPGCDGDGSSNNPPPTPDSEVCDNGQDDDGDGLADCDDDDCASAAGCGAPPACGDGALSVGEACDGTNIGGQTCQGLGFAGGTLSCTASCTLDQSGCVGGGDCGNGTLDAGEACDGMDLGGQTCQGLGFAGGTLACAAGCTLDQSGCTSVPDEVCGNGLDDDGDGLYDCEDPACAGAPGCAFEICGNGLDDDMNGLADCDDPACAVEPFCLTEICGNGLDDNGDGLVDCDDAQCQADPTCAGGGEAICDDFQDDDGNGYIDCEDPACQVTMTCAPGMGAVGTPCDMNGQCAANGNDPLCVAEPWSGWPMGYCSEFCDVMMSDCAPGALCLDVGLSSGNGLCFDQCATSADCRSGYYCDTASGSVCVAGQQPEICGNMMDDNGDGLVDCADPQCQNDPSCPELVCDDWSDNDGDGLMDCQDPSCQATMTCAPGMGAAGAPCTANNQCASTSGNDPFCITEAMGGWLGGYCAEFCDVAANDCGAGALCLDAGVNPPSGNCFDVCNVTADCRAGYTCLDVGVGVDICVYQ